MLGRYFNIQGGQAFHAFAAPALHIHHAIWRDNSRSATQFFDVCGNQSRPKLASQTQRVGDGGFIGMGGGGSELGMSNGRGRSRQSRLDVGAHHLDGFAVAFGNHVSNVEAVRGDLTGQFGAEPQSGVLGCRLREDASAWSADDRASAPSPKAPTGPIPVMTTL